VATVVVASIIAALGALELVALGGSTGTAMKVLQVVAAAAFCAIVSTESSDVPFIILTPLLLLAGIVQLSRGVPDRKTIHLFSGAGIFYVGVPLGAIARLRLLDGAEAVSVLALMVIASDSAQYFIGRALGRHKLAPSISPAKTIEGAVGGLMASAAVGAWLGPHWLPGVNISSGGLLGVLVGIVGMMGDLFESALKRGAGVKDSSHLIPGHGGVLDRIDSLLYTAPLFFHFTRYAHGL